MSDTPIRIDSAQNPALGQTRFGERKLTPRETMQRTAALCAMSSPKPKCTGQVFVGLFFDGTGNNEKNDYGTETQPKELRQQKHSNVVRLYHAHPNNIIVGGNGYYRYYIPGVGTPFPEIGDTSWFGKKLGSAFANKGSPRIVWGLTRVFNAVSQYVYRDDFIKDSNAATIANDDGWLSEMVSKPIRNWRLGSSASSLQAQLKAKIANRLPKIEGLTLNVFGFSRGAAEARAFVNWFFKLCEQKDGGWLFAGIPVRVQFLGLFDTVASVGIAGLYTFAEGHLDWADQNMQIHPAVERCVHMAAAHEVRACFPLDSVRVGAKYPNNVIEYVYPGSHSDVGGGYMPQSLGKDDWNNGAKDGADDHQVARIPCYEMYHVALAAGVPFRPFQQGGAFKQLTPEFRQAIKPSEDTVKAFDDYCKAAAIKPGPVEDMARQHMSLYFTHRWRAGAGKRVEGPVEDEMQRAHKKPNKGEDYDGEAGWMSDTQIALISVIAALCAEIGRRIQDNGKSDEALRQPFDLQDIGALSAWTTQLDIAAKGVAAGAVARVIPLGIFASPTAREFSERSAWVSHCRDNAADFAKVNALAQKAPDYLQRWRDFITRSERQAEIRETAVERDGVQLLEALRPEGLTPGIRAFFDHHVHDSMAGFIGFGMPEFQANGYGIGKFRRIFFGNEGDAMLRKAAEDRNKKNIDAANTRRANRRQWDAESAAYQRTIPRWR
ncbi:MAG: DUF2235 domain-containing protein [Burkholderiaceae bacterium]|jgi:hypothetical protein|nr:DUF2235 domain-containing protein [Burkholderiaceae bacterium]